MPPWGPQLPPAGRDRKRRLMYIVELELKMCVHSFRSPSNISEAGKLHLHLFSTSYWKEQQMWSISDLGGLWITAHCWSSFGLPAWLVSFPSIPYLGDPFFRRVIVGTRWYKVGWLGSVPRWCAVLPDITALAAKYVTAVAVGWVV